MKWFGPTWGAPICKPKDMAPTPVGEKCSECGGTIRDMDQGLVIPQNGGWRNTYWHLNCFLHNIGLLKEKKYEPKSD